MGQGGAGRWLSVLWTVGLAVLWMVPAAHAQFRITDWRAQVYNPGPEVDENVFDLAGAHPFIGVTDFRLDGSSNAKNIRVDVPPGLVPNPDKAPRCAMDDLEAGECPDAAQIGTERLTIRVGPADMTVRVPLYNMEIDDDQVSRFGFNPADAAGLVGGLAGLHPVEIIGGVRDSLAESNPPGAGEHQFPADLGLFFTISDAPASPSVVRSELTFWGVPGDPVHAPELGTSCVEGLPLCLGGPTGPPPDPDLPFLTTPTVCAGVPTRTRLIVESHSGAFDSELELTPTIDDKDGPQECENVPFAPRLEMVPAVTEPDSPAGPEVTLRVPQEGLEDKDVLTTAHIKGVSVTLPPGMTINPSAANGLEACTDAQFEAGAGVPGGDECPEASRIGTVEVSTPLLPQLPGQSADPPVDLAGAAFVGQPLPGDMYRLFLTVEGRGVSVRLNGSVRPDPATGQLTTVFDQGNPQLPFDRLTVDFRDGPRAPLATPLDCGPTTATGTFTPYSGTPPVTSPSGFEIAGAGCPAAFEPLFGARAGTPAGGAFSPFFVSIRRDDRNQYLSGVTVELPPGIGARIRGVEQCPDALAATGNCPAASRIGTATTSAGAGSEPFSLSGPVYFTGPYRGAPFGMVVVIRAIAGPFDLGTVVVRQAIFVDPDDAHLTVASDPLPTILAGVPIRLRTVDIAIDRPQFVYNPTSCGDKQAGATLRSTQGATAGRAAGLRFDGCEALPFAPRMSMRLIGPRRMAPGRHPGLIARVTQGDGQANIGRARVQLPLSLALDPFNTRTVCGYEAGLRAECPRSTRIGSATAVSPALNEPLKGPVYLVQGIRIHPQTGARIRTLPSLLATLTGEVRVNLRGTTDVEKLRLVSTFDRVPDAPVSNFELRVAGGRRGILAVTGRRRGICQRRRVSDVQLTGHNAKQAASRVKMVAPCRSPGLRIRRARVRGGRLVVRGTVARQAGKRVRVELSCGETRVAKAARRPKPVRWVAGLRLRGNCGGADRARLRVVYPGGGAFKRAVRARRVAL